MDVNSQISIAGPARDATPGKQPPAPADEPSDADLAKLAADGDQNAAGILINRYQPMVRRFLRKLTSKDDIADDLAQDTFVRLLRYIDRYDPKYPMRTWLLTIARRLSINRHQREKKMIVVDEFKGLPANTENPLLSAEQHDEHNALKQKLDQAMTHLTEPQRQAVLLFHQQELSVQQVASVMGMPIGTVKSHLHRARAAMRKILSATDTEQAS